MRAAAHTPWLRRVAIAVAALAALTAVTPGVTGSSWTDEVAVESTVQSSWWATRICLIYSVEDRPDVGLYSLGSQAQLGNSGWTEVVDARAAKTNAELSALDCSVVMIAAEAWGITPDKRDVAMAWYTAGGSVLSTGNDTGYSNYPFPLMIDSLGDNKVAQYPYGGSIPADPSVLNSLSPAFPSWTPGTHYELDPTSYPIGRIAAGATCVGTVSGHPEWCAAIARVEPSSGGRWVHLHTKIGDLTRPGEVPGADAALQWLAIGKS